MERSVLVTDQPNSGMDRRIVEAGAQEPADEAAGHALRPGSLKAFIGQRRVRENLAVFIAAARERGEVLDHVLLTGPPGLGKTTLARIVAEEMGTGFRPTSAPTLARAGDLAALLGSLQPNDVLFIDEIHRLPIAVEETLYTAMEDFQLDLLIGEGPSARSLRIDLPAFTLVGATTRAGALSRPLRERFGIPLHLDFYDQADLELIITRAAALLGLEATAEGVAEIACRSRGTPRIAGRLLRRVRDFTTQAGLPYLSGEGARYALDRLEVDGQGLDATDRRYLRLLAEGFGGGPVGVETLAAALGEQRDVLEEVVEPFLIQRALLQRTPRGRQLTASGWRCMDGNETVASRRSAA